MSKNGMLITALAHKKLYGKSIRQKYFYRKRLKSRLL